MSVDTGNDGLTLRSTTYNFKGRLAGIEGDEIVLQQDQEEYLFPFDLVDKAQVVPEFK